MMAILVVFYIFVLLFGVIGAMRGWAKEILVIFSVVLALALITVFETFVPVLGPFLRSNIVVQFWVRFVILILIVFFGYQSPKLSRLQGGAARRDRIQDVLLGLILGLVSGFLVIGSLWWFMDAAGYPFAPAIRAPTPTDPLGDASLRLIQLLPPQWLMRVPHIFIAVVLAFIFVLVVFI